MEASEEDEINPGLAERLGRLASSTSPANNGTPASSTSAKSGHSQHSSPDRDGERKKAFKLVTYNDPDDEEQTNDAEPSDEDRSSVPMELESDAEDDKETKENGEHEVQKELERVNILEDLWKEGVKLPPEPEGFCRKKLQDKINAAMEKKMKEGYNYNRVIQSKKAFRNPSIYEKLIIHLNIDELGTNFPPNLYDGHLFGKESYYDELSKVQKSEMDRREKAQEAKKKSGDSSRLKESGSQNVQHRKSKWDVAGGGGGGGGVSRGPGPVISAFGSLNKRK